jgi:aspartokinase
MRSGKLRTIRLTVSDPMLGLSINRNGSQAGTPASFHRLFADNGVNLTFISTKGSHAGETCFCCVCAEDGPIVKQLLEDRFPLCSASYRIVPSVTLLGIFPHQSDLRLALYLLQALWVAQIPMHAMASSIAALTLAIDTHRIKTAHAALERYLEMQTNSR